MFLGSDFISVTKGDGEWQHLKPVILGAIMEHYMSGAPVVGGESRNDGGRVSYDPKDEDTSKTIKELLDTRVRPAVANDGGDIVFSELQGRRRVPAHARGLRRLPELDGHVAPRHREPAQAFLPRRAGSSRSLAPATRSTL